MEDAPDRIVIIARGGSNHRRLTLLVTEEPPFRNTGWNGPPSFGGR